MYVPPAFRFDDAEALHAAIRRHSFGTLVTHGEGGMIASHLPFLLQSDAEASDRLRGHMARANPQWKEFPGSKEVLVLFQGPHAYISPSWYETREAVPTWNYEAVHVYGTPHLIDDPAAVRALLDETAAVYEAVRPEPWSANQMPAGWIDKLQRGIVGFEIRITRIEGKRKLSQNRPEADQIGVLAGLRDSGDPDDLALARLMEQVLGFPR